MKRTHGLISLLAASAVLGVVACGNNAQPADASLAADLKAASAGSTAGDVQLAPRGNPAQVVVSALEGGPQSAPKQAAPKKVYHATPKATTRVASRTQPAPAPAPDPRPVVQQPAPTPAPTPVEPAPAPQPAPAPVAAPTPGPTTRQPGVYKTEGEIFQKMPWIRP